MINVLLVEDQRLLREGIEAIIARTEDIKVIGTAEDGEAAIGQMEALQPDVVLMDIHMPKMDGIETLVRLKENNPNVKVVMLTTNAEEELVLSAIVFGADGFLLKGLYAKKLVDSIRDAFLGDIVLSGDVARMLVNRIRELTMDKQQLLAVRLERSGYQFTKREVDIAYLLMENHTNSQIANKLYLGEGTVKNYISDIYTKLDVHNRAKAISIFQRLFNENEDI